MDDRVWVGPDSDCPAGWAGCKSVEALLNSSGSPRLIVVNDLAGVLREADFAGLYQQVPLARIERIVGPWRAGVGRTDPQWPLATTRRDDLAHEVDSPDEFIWHPLTSGYDDLAVEDAVLNLTDLTLSVQIADAELREMWEDWLTHSGCRLGDSRVDVLIRDCYAIRAGRAATVARSIVTLSPDPWNSAEASCQTWPANDMESLEARELAASVLDSPARVMQRVLASLQRVEL